MISNDNHIWICDNPLNPERITYRFTDTDKQESYQIILEFRTDAQCWDTYLCRDNKQPDELN